MHGDGAFHRQVGGARQLRGMRQALVADSSASVIGVLTPVLIVASICWRDQPEVSFRSQVERSRTFCTRTQPDDSKRISLLKRPCWGVSCMYSLFWL